MDIKFGFAEEWSDFGRRHALFLERFENLRAAKEAAFAPGQSQVDPVDRVVYFLGLVCFEDFYEIMLLAGNGYGVGCQKILRGMYERAVTMVYLSEQPDKIDAFMNYHAVSQYKLAQVIKRVYGDEFMPPKVDAKVTADYQAVRDEYLIAACKECGTTRVNHTWSKLDFVAMAHKAGDLGRLIVPGYYVPLKYSHCTIEAITARLEQTEGGLGFNPDAQRAEADSALQTAHNIALRVIELQWKHFDLGDDVWEKRAVCHQDFMDVWGGKEEKKT